MRKTFKFTDIGKRFTSRRGLCSRIYSDNATNFVGSDRHLKMVIRDMLAAVKKDRDVSEFLLKNGIDWSFIPARSPHQGGLWKSAVKLAKYHIV